MGNTYDQVVKGKENNVEYSRSQSDARYKGEEPVASKMTSATSFILSLPLHQQQCLLQWNLRIKDTLGAELLSSFQRLSFGGRFKPICNL